MPQLFIGFPSRFDLREQNKVNPVRDQGKCGVCWAFAAFSSLESSLLPKEVWDFSENNLKNTHGFDSGPCGAGNMLMPMAYLARWAGPVKEADDPYKPSSVSSPSNLFVQKHFKESLILSYAPNYRDLDQLKEILMSYGAIWTQMYWRDEFYDDQHSAYYNPNTDGDASDGHAVTIIGWDDNFDGKKFGTATARLPNGAFIVQNTWGADFGDKGYFYVSYADPYFGTENAVFNLPASPTEYTQIYQYDPLGWVGDSGYGADSGWMANVFTAIHNELLQAVGFYAAEFNSQYVIYIYSNITTAPVGKTLLGSLNGTIQFPGYHTISLADKNIQLKAGNKFSVVVRLKTPGYDYPIPIEYYVEDYSSQATANPGESFTSFDGKYWDDPAADENTNVCLKAFTTARCDDDNACTDDVLVNNNCSHLPKSAGSICRSAADICDLPEYCDGNGAPCPPDKFKANTIICRLPANVCDLAEKCPGNAAACPADIAISCTPNSCQISSICQSGGSCKIVNKLDGTACDDHNALTRNDRCQNGQCVGAIFSCIPNQCQLSSIPDGKGGCVSLNKPNGVACNDNNNATKNDLCINGVCAGTPYACQLNACLSSSIPDGKGGCLTSAKPDNTPCDDSNPCSKNDRCSDGACTGSAYSCVAGPCHSAMLCDGFGGCSAVNKPDGASCNDNDLSTKNDSCISGACRGTPYSCAPTPCQVSALPDGKGGCAVINKVDGVACDDQRSCTQGDKCMQGQCAGIAYQCTPKQCELSSICDGAGGCVIRTKPNGAVCDDQNPSTQNDHCANGVCIGERLNPSAKDAGPADARDSKDFTVLPKDSIDLQTISQDQALNPNLQRNDLDQHNYMSAKDGQADSTQMAAKLDANITTYPQSSFNNNLPTTGCNCQVSSEPTSRGQGLYFLWLLLGLGLRKITKIKNQ